MQINVNRVGCGLGSNEFINLFLFPIAFWRLFMDSGLSEKILDSFVLRRV